MRVQAQNMMGKLCDCVYGKDVCTYNTIICIYTPMGWYGTPMGGLCDHGMVLDHTVHVLIEGTFALVDGGPTMHDCNNTQIHICAIAC